MYTYVFLCARIYTYMHKYVTCDAALCFYVSPSHPLATLLP